MKTIRIDDEVWRALQKKGTAFEDTPNSVLRKILRLDKANGREKRNVQTSRVPRGQKTPQQAYHKPILRILYELGGSAPAPDVLDRVGKAMARELNAVDRGQLGRGELRWRNTAQWARNELVKQGYLKRNSPHGTWELTAKGIAAVENEDNGVS
jgi:restriction system protein